MVRSNGLTACVSLFVFVSLAKADGYAVCTEVNRASYDNVLHKWKDRDVDNRLCRTLRELAYAIAAKDQFYEQICGRASGVMVDEFRRRFPSRDAAPLARGC